MTAYNCGWRAGRDLIVFAADLRTRAGEDGYEANQRRWTAPRRRLGAVPPLNTAAEPDFRT